MEALKYIFLESVFTRVSLFEYCLKIDFSNPLPFKKKLRYNFCFVLIEIRMSFVIQGKGGNLATWR